MREALFMVRVIVGLIKGALVGGGVGYGLVRLGWTSSLIAYLACAVVGAGVGLVAGRPPWRSETLWTPAIKLIVGALIGVGLCAMGFKLLPDPSFHTSSLGTLSLHSGPVLAPLVGILYGIFVEVDDGARPSDGPSDRKEKKANA
jgi:hypothetical protein